MCAEIILNARQRRTVTLPDTASGSINAFPVRRRSMQSALGGRNYSVDRQRANAIEMTFTDKRIEHQMNRQRQGIPIICSLKLQFNPCSSCAKRQRRQTITVAIIIISCAPESIGCPISPERRLRSASTEAKIGLLNGVLWLQFGRVLVVVARVLFSHFRSVLEGASTIPYPLNDVWHRRRSEHSMACRTTEQREHWACHCLRVERKANEKGKVKQTKCMNKRCKDKSPLFLSFDAFCNQLQIAS